MSGTLCVEKKHGNASVEEVWDLVDRAKEGDRAAFEELYRLHVDPIKRYLQIRVGDTHDAEDLTTQTFLKMLESIGRYNRRAVPFGAWLFRIAHNLAVDHFRATRRWRPADEVPEPLGRHEPSAEDKALDSLAHKRMLKLMNRLSGDQQKVLTLKFVLDYSNGEAATILGKSEGSVKSLQHRALDTLSVAMRAPGARAA
ncbi:MAG: sigma-70 family RNA polymerase sigma factor [Actinobacteria bacterium]|nr:sigma-70 family RNA polymerase sigma factor [Actinomycetota bacterium]